MIGKKIITYNYLNNIILLLIITNIITGVKREDPLKILDPSSKKLVTVESQRIMAVLDDTICRIRLVTLLPELTQNTDR